MTETIELSRKTARVESPRLLNRLIKGTGLNLIAVVFNQGSTLIVNIIVARILLKIAFGEYAIVQSTLLAMSTLSQLATGYTALKYVAEFRSSDPARAGRIMGLCVLVSSMMSGIGSLLLIAMAPWLADSMLKAPQLAVPLMIGSGFVFFASINGYQTGALAGLESYNDLAKAGVVSGIVAVACISFGALTGGLNGTLIGLTVSAFFRCGIHNIWLRHECRRQAITLQYRGTFDHEKDIIFRFALPAVVAGYCSTLSIWLVNSLLVRQPGGYGEMAVYGAAFNLRSLILFLPNVMNSVGLSILNNEKSKGDSKHYNRVYLFNVANIFVVSLAGVLAMGLFGRWILLLFGKNFAAGYSLLWLLLFSGLAESVSLAVYQYVQSKARIWLSFFSLTLPKETSLVVIGYYLVPSYGGVGLAGAYLAATLIGLICNFSLVTFIHFREAQAEILVSPSKSY